MDANQKRALAERSEEGGGDAAIAHPPVRDIRDLISFRLSNIVAANDRVGQNWAQTKFGLSLNEWRVLGLTYALEPVILSDIKNILHIDKGQLSRIIKSMVERRYLRSDPRSDNQRFTELRMTARGRALHQKMLTYSTQRNRTVVEDLTQHEASELFRLLEKLRTGIDRRLAALEACQ